MAGERIAINLLNVKKEEIERGDVLTNGNSFILSNIIICELSLFSKDYTVQNVSVEKFNFGSKQKLM